MGSSTKNLRQFIIDLYYKYSGIFIPVVPNVNPAADWVSYKMYPASLDPTSPTISMSIAVTPATLIAVFQQLVRLNADPNEPKRVIDLSPFGAEFMRIGGPGTLLEELLNEYGSE